MLYLTTHSTHFIYGLYGVGHMVKDQSDSERGNPLPPHRPTLSDWVLLYAPSHRQDSTYHGLCYQSWKLAGTRNSSMDLFSCLNPLKVQACCPEHTLQLRGNPLPPLHGLRGKIQARPCNNKIELCYLN